jgi:hypothetical protein
VASHRALAAVRSPTNRSAVLLFGCDPHPPFAPAQAGRLIAILLTGGEAHDCPVAERLVRRVKPSKRMLGDKAYDSAELSRQPWSKREAE